jgi:hypothetical protein
MEGAGVFRERPEAGDWNQFRRNSQILGDGQHARAIRAGVAMLPKKGAGDNSKHHIVRWSEPLGLRRVKELRVGLPLGEMPE